MPLLVSHEGAHKPSWSYDISILTDGEFSSSLVSLSFLLLRLILQQLMDRNTLCDTRRREHPLRRRRQCRCRQAGKPRGEPQQPDRYLHRVRPFPSFMSSPSSRPRVEDGYAKARADVCTLVIGSGFGFKDKTWAKKGGILETDKSETKVRFVLHSRPPSSAPLVVVLFAFSPANDLLTSLFIRALTPFSSSFLYPPPLS